MLFRRLFVSLVLATVATGAWISYSDRLHAYDTGRNMPGGHHDGNWAGYVGFDYYRVDKKLRSSVVSFDAFQDTFELPLVNDQSR